MDEQNTTGNVPYIVFEGEMARAERHNKRMARLLIIAIILMFLSNFLWLMAWVSYDYSGTDIEVANDGTGNANYVGRNGEIKNGIKDQSADENTDAERW